MKRDYFVQYALFSFGLVAPFILLGLEDTYLLVSNISDVQHVI